MSRIFLTALAFVALGLFAVSHAQMRHALIVGNSLYEWAPLPNPTNDADDMASVLRALGFSVTLVKDAGLSELQREVRAFSERLRPGDVALFFYAGHGAQLNGIPYVIPVDSEIYQESHIRTEAYSAQHVVDAIASSQVGLGIVIFDACRNNPFEFEWDEGAEGLAPLEVPRPEGASRAGAPTQPSGGQDFAIIYSTQPGNVASDGSGRNSPFTGALVEALSQRAFNFDALLRTVTRSVREQTRNRQEPWVSTSIAREYSYNFLAVAETGPAPTGVIALQPGQEDEFLKLALAGGTVYLGSGTFNLPAPLVASASLEVVGAGQGRTTVHWRGSEPLVEWNQNDALSLKSLTLRVSGAATVPVIVARGGQLELSDVEVTGTMWNAIHLLNQANVQIVDSNLRDNGGTAVLVGGQAIVSLRNSMIRNNKGAGVRFEGFGSGAVEGNVIEGNIQGLMNVGSGSPGVHGNTIINNASVGVTAGRNSPFTLLNNLVSENRGAGVELSSGAAQGNRIVGNANAGLVLFGRSLRVVDNEVVSNTGVGVYVTGGAVELLQNLISGNGGGGIDVAGSSPVMRGNRVVENLGTGVYISADPSRGGGTGGQLVDNTVSGNDGHGVLLTDNAGALVKDNRIRNNNGFGLGYLGRSGGTALGNLIEGNEFGGVVLEDTASPTMTENQVRSNKGHGIVYRNESAGIASRNQIARNEQDGVRVVDDARPVIRDNRLEANAWGGIVFQGRSGGIAEANQVVSNLGHGIFCGAEAGARLNQNHLLENQWLGIGMHTGSSCASNGNTFSGNVQGDTATWTPD